MRKELYRCITLVVLFVAMVGMFVPPLVNWFYADASDKAMVYAAKDQAVPTWTPEEIDQLLLQMHDEVRRSAGWTYDYYFAFRNRLTQIQQRAEVLAYNGQNPQYHQQLALMNGMRNSSGNTFWDAFGKRPDARAIQQTDQFRLAQDSSTLYDYRYRDFLSPDYGVEKSAVYRQFGWTFLASLPFALVATFFLLMQMYGTRFGTTLLVFLSSPRPWLVAATGPFWFVSGPFFFHHVDNLTFSPRTLAFALTTLMCGAVGAQVPALGQSKDATKKKDNVLSVEAVERMEPDLIASDVLTSTTRITVQDKKQGAFAEWIGIRSRLQSVDYVQVGKRLFSVGSVKTRREFSFTPQVGFRFVAPSRGSPATYLVTGMRFKARAGRVTLVSPHTALETPIAGDTSKPMSYVSILRPTISLTKSFGVVQEWVIRAGPRAKPRITPGIYLTWKAAPQWTVESGAYRTQAGVWGARMQILWRGEFAF